MPSIESIVDTFSRKSLERRWVPLGFVALLVLLAVPSPSRSARQTM